MPDRPRSDLVRVGPSQGEPDPRDVPWHIRRQARYLDLRQRFVRQGWNSWTADLLAREAFDAECAGDP